MRISDWSSDVCSSDLWLRNGLSDRIPRRPDRRLAEKPDSPLLCFGVPGKVERRVRMPLGRNQGGGAGRRPAPGDIRPKGIRNRRPLSFGVRCFFVWEKTFLLRGGVPEIGSAHV